MSLEFAPWRSEEGLDPVMRRWLASDRIRPCFAAEKRYEPTDGATVPVPSSLHPSLVTALAKRGIERLYTHQARAVDVASRKRPFVVATPTASGKSLCFHLPVLDTLLRQASLGGDARALYFFPTKALARDQEAAVHELLEAAGERLAVVTYDGDTPADARRAARERAGIIVTNPDMLHTGILPHHTAWARTFQNLRFIVIDELHTYRGVFGSHVANVIRRLMRVARFHGASPLLVGATATIGNPREHAARLFGMAPEDVEVIAESGAPRGERKFFFYNPPVVNEELGIRASYVKQTVSLAADLVRARVPTIVFGPSRNSVEMMLKYLREQLKDARIEPNRVMAYRGGYLPHERRDIERRLRTGDILCVVATSALELGIDVGSLDAVVCASYPGTVAAMWQRFGRAGRRGAQSMCVLVACSAPLDQFLAREPEFLLGAAVEEARIDPDNVEVLVQHLKCAAFELPFRHGDAFGSLGSDETRDALEFLASHHVLHDSGGSYHWAADAYPANEISLRSVGWDNVVVIDVAKNESFAELDWRSAHTMLHEQAIYQHDAETWQVERFDYENHKAYVRKVEPDYFTTALTHTKVSILEVAESCVLPGSGARAPMAHFGEVRVTEKVVGYKKVKFQTHENAGYGDVRLPEMEMHTTAFWLTLATRVDGSAEGGTSRTRNVDGSAEGGTSRTRNVDGSAEGGTSRTRNVDSLRGLGIALETVSTFSLMCDARDIGMALDDERHVEADTVTLYLYEQVPGGTGLAQRMFALRHDLFARARKLIASCPCSAGCPACVGPSESNARKRGALELLDLITWAG
jgi:DEAD/DEAH box helicase domain-containing protein